jgi:hypothetical protein
LDVMDNWITHKKLWHLSYDVWVKETTVSLVSFKWSVLLSSVYGRQTI